MVGEEEQNLYLPKNELTLPRSKLKIGGGIGRRGVGTKVQKYFYRFLF